MVERLFLAVPWGCLRFVIVVFPDHTHLFFSGIKWKLKICVSFAVKYILIFMKLTSFILMWAEHEKGIISSVPGML